MISILNSVIFTICATVNGKGRNSRYVLRQSHFHAKVRVVLGYWGKNTMLKKSLFSLLLLILIFGLAAPSANAQQYDGDTVDITIRENSKSLFPRHYYTVDFFNNPRDSESKFTIQLASHGEVSGCAKMSRASVKNKTEGDTINLTVRDPQLRVNKRAPRYTLTDCDLKLNRSFFDVELDRDELIERGIKHIDLRSRRYGQFFTSDIKVSKEKIELTAKTPTNTSLITFWFMPQDTVILHTPNSKRDLDVQSIIRDFGISQGLIPLEDTYRDFELPYDAYDYVYFTNPEGDMVSQVSSVDEIVPVGSITPTRTMHTANGQVEEPYDLTVYAAIPGQSDEEEEK